MWKIKLDDIFYGALIIATMFAGLLTFIEANKGELFPIFIWTSNCSLIWVAGSIIDQVRHYNTN